MEKGHTGSPAQGAFRRVFDALEVIDDDKLLKKLELGDLKKEQVCVQPGTDRWRRPRAQSLSASRC